MIMPLHALLLLLRWLHQAAEPERCPTCGQDTGDTLSLTHWPQYTHCPHCDADLCPL